MWCKRIGPSHRRSHIELLNWSLGVTHGKSFERSPASNGNRCSVPKAKGKPQPEATRIWLSAGRFGGCKFGSMQFND